MPTRITLSVGAFFTKELIILEDMTLPPDLVTRFVVSITPFAPSVSTFSWPFGRLEVSFLTVLNAISVSDTSTEAPARSILMTVFSFTFVSKDGETVSSVSRVMSPASSTVFTSVKCMPGNHAGLAVDLHGDSTKYLRKAPHGRCHGRLRCCR